MQESERRALFESVVTGQLHAQAWAYATRLCRTREDAEDLLQDALARAYASLHQLRQPELVRSWLFAILRAQSINRTRRAPLDLAATWWFQSALARDYQQPLTDPLARALAQLSPEQREVLTLFYLDGLSLAETGRVLRCSAQAVGQRLHRARQALRRRLTALAPAPPAVEGQTNEA